MRTRDARLSAPTPIKGNVVNVVGKANDIYTKGWISNTYNFGLSLLRKAP